MMSRLATRNGTLLNSVPEPLGFNAFGPECLAYIEGTRTEDRAPSGMRPERRFERRNGKGTASMPRPPQNTQIPTRPRLTYCGPKLVLTKGSTLEFMSRDGMEEGKVSINPEGDGLSASALYGTDA